MGTDRFNRSLLLGAAAGAYGLVFSAMWVVGRPELGIASFFLVPTCLLALAGGPRAGAAGAALSAGLYFLTLLHHVGATSPALPIASVIRAAALLCIGVLIGWFAERNRSLLGELRTAAERDFLTGLGNARAFETAVQRRCQAGKPFVLLLADLDLLKQTNDEEGHRAGDHALKRLAATLQAELDRDDDLARVGGDEFSILTPVATAEEAGSLAARLEMRARLAGSPATFGWALYPSETTDHIGLFNLADGRLYSRKRGRGLRLANGRQLKAVASE